MRELLAKLPNGDQVLALTPHQLDAVLISCVAERERASKQDPIATRFLSRGELENIYPVSMSFPAVRQQQVDSLLMASCQRLLSDGFIMPAPGQPAGVITATPKGMEVAGTVSFDEIKARQTLPRELLHPDLQGSVYDTFANGHYDTAVRDAFVLIEDAVRNAAGLPAALLGVKLMREAFNPNSGKLTNMALPIAERERMADLFAGAIGTFKTHYHIAG